MRMTANCFGHILRRNCLLKHVIEMKTEGRREVTGTRRTIYKLLWMTSRKREDAGNLKWELEIALYRKIVLKDAMDLSIGRLRNDE